MGQPKFANHSGLLYKRCRCRYCGHTRTHSYRELMVLCWFVVTVDDIVEYYSLARLATVRITASTQCYGYLIGSLAMVSATPIELSDATEPPSLDEWRICCTFMDQTATLENVRLFGSAASSMLALLGASLSVQQIRDQVRQLLWRRFKVSFKVSQCKDEPGVAHYSILACTEATANEFNRIRLLGLPLHASST
jgi:hypothetical protein